MRITYLGQCGFLLEDGGARVCTDPYLTYHVDEAHYTPDTPWVRAYEPPIQPEELECDLIVISHPHDDHMDPDTLTRWSGHGGSAPVLCPAPSLALAESYGVKNCTGAAAGAEYRFRGVTVTPVPCAHTELHTDENGLYRELSYLIRMPSGLRVFFGGDMSLYDGLEERVRSLAPDILLLPANGRTEELTRKGIIGNLSAREAAEFSARLRVPYIPMHFDLYGFNGCPRAEVEKAARDAGAELYMPVPGGTIEFR